MGAARGRSEPAGNYPPCQRGAPAWHCIAMLRYGTRSNLSCARRKLFEKLYRRRSWRHGAGQLSVQYALQITITLSLELLDINTPGYQEPLPESLVKPLQNEATAEEGEDRCAFTSKFSNLQNEFICPYQVGQHQLVTSTYMISQSCAKAK